MSEKIKLYKSNFAEQVLRLNGEKFSFAIFPPKRIIYDDPAPTIIFKTSRQVGKSSDIANMMVLDSMLYNGFKSLYIAPRQKTKSDFAHQRITPLIENSPYVKINFTSYRLTSNVEFQMFTNGSYIQLKNAYQSDMPLRGPSSDRNYWDEFQDANPAIFNVGQQTLSRSLFKRTVLAGTPKHTLTPLEKWWQASTKYEFFIKCIHCNEWNLPSLENIGPDYAICRKCGKELTPDKWELVRTGSEKSVGLVHGYHYNKLHLAIFRDKGTNWKIDVWNKLQGIGGKAMSLTEFKNEVLGECDDSSIRPITESDIYRCCSEFDWTELTDFENLVSSDKHKLKDLLNKKLYMAIDWGTTNTSTSNTVIVVGYPLPYTNNNSPEPIIKIIHIKHFLGEESGYDFIMNYIYKLLQYLPNIVFIGADNGMGQAQNSLIRSRYGHDKVFGFQFTSNQLNKVKWHVVEGTTQEQLNAYFTINKVMAYDQFFNEIKDGKWEFPKPVEKFERCVQEILNVEQQFDEDRNKYIYTHLSENPDDFASCLIYLRTLIELAAGIN